MKPRITLLQLKLKKGQKEKNLKHALDLIDDNKDSDFICLPEEFLCLGDYSKTNVETIPGRATKELIGRAKKHRLFIIGSFIEKDREKYYNSIPVIGPKGILGIYRKMHIYRADKSIRTKEGKKIVSPGEEVKIFKNRFGKFGVAICKDIYYPEIFRSLKLKGAKFVFIPAEDWAPDFFEHMACTRALENEIYVCLVNSWSEGKKHRGRSLIACPYKEIIKCNEGETILKTEIDLKHNWIGKEKIFDDIKFKSYGLGKHYK